MAEDATAARRQIDEQSCLEPGVIDEDVRPLEDLLPGVAEDECALIQLRKHLVAGSEQIIGGGDAVGAISGEVERELRIGTVDADPDLRRRSERIGLDPVDENGDRSEGVAAADLLEIAVAATVEVMQSRGEIRLT